MQVKKNLLRSHLRKRLNRLKMLKKLSGLSKKLKLKQKKRSMLTLMLALQL